MICDYRKYLIKTIIKIIPLLSSLLYISSQIEHIVMTPFTAVSGKQKIQFTVPSGYEDLTIRQYIRLSKWDKERDGILALVQILTGLSSEVIDNITEDEAMNKIVHLLEWATVAPEFMGEKSDPLPVPEEILLLGKGYIVPQDIELETFGQKVSLQVHLSLAQRDKLTVAELMPTIIAIYMHPTVTGDKYDEDKALLLMPEIDKLNLLEAYAVGNFFLVQFNKIIDREIEQIPSKPDSDQSMAGIDKLNPFGIYGTIDALAGGDLMKHDAILLQQYREIFVKLKYDYEKHNFQDRYSTIMRNK